MDQTFMKEKPVFPLLLSMGVPMILSMLAGALYNVVDSIFVARISGDAMTALSLVFPLQNLITAVGVGFSVGAGASAARALGANRQDLADGAASQGFFLNLLHGFAVMTLGLLFMPVFLRFYTDSLPVIDYSLTYSRIVFCFAPIYMTAMIWEKLFQAEGRMKIAMGSMLFGCIFNVILDPLVIYGIGPFPKLGIAGAAWATGISETLSLAIYLVVDRFRPLNLRIRPALFLPTAEIAVPMYSVGLACALSMSLPSLLISCLNAILSAFSGVYVLILGIYYRLQLLLYQVSNGLVQGMRPLIAYNYGAKEYSRVREIARTALKVVAFFMLCGTLLAWLIPGTLLHFYTDDPEILSGGIHAMRIMSCGFLFSAVSVIAGGSLEALGNGPASLVISLLRCFLFIVPAAFLLSRFLGPAGVWHSFWIAEGATALAAWGILKKEWNKMESGQGSGQDPKLGSSQDSGQGSEQD